MLQTSNYSLVLFLQFLLLFYDLFVNSFSELLRTAPAVQLVLFIIQDIAILFNVIIIFLMFFNTFVFQAGLVNLLFHKFKGTILLSAAYLALSISFHIWVMGQQPVRGRHYSRLPQPGSEAPRGHESLSPEDRKVKPSSRPGLGRWGQRGLRRNSTPEEPCSPSGVFLEDPHLRTHDRRPKLPTQ
ncbi:PREDICTED: transmembrane protein 138, partial [Pygoscelis adeliae]